MAPRSHPPPHGSLVPYLPAGPGGRIGRVPRALPSSAATQAAIRWLACACVVLAAGCASLPPLEPREPSMALAGTASTRLGVAVAPLAAANPGRTGVFALALPTDAFAARMLLAAAAERSIDAQYYIWHGDETGTLLFEALAAAAARGVRVRILLDDQNTRGIEEVLAALDARANLEVRLYNPFASRGA